MRDTPSDTHEYPPEIQEYLLKLTELPDGFIPRSLEVYYKPSRPLTLLRLTCSQRKQLQRPTTRMSHFTIKTSSVVLIDFSLISFTTIRPTESITRDFDALIHIQKAANYCERHSSDENDWCQEVVVPLLKIALHKPEFSIGKVVSV